MEGIAGGCGKVGAAVVSWSPSDIEGIGQRIMCMKSSGRHQEAVALEREFDAAVRERRIGI